MTWWFSKDEVPALYKEDWDFEYKSKPVLGYLTDGTMRVVFAQQYEDESEVVKWYTSCGEQWDVTSCITHWTELPEPPTK